MSGVNCNICPHNCKIKEGQTGLCKVRKVIDGVVVPLTYGKFSAINIDPIEKKPLYHVKPGSKTLSLGSIGCNFKCPWCQNWEISQNINFNNLTNLTPEELIDLTRSSGLDSITFTYNEPIINYEYVLEAAKAFSENSIKTYLVSAGYINKSKMEPFFENISAANVDLKSFNEETYKKLIGGELSHVLDTLKFIQKSEIWLEITTLLIPDVNDSEEEIKKLCSWIYNELGDRVPLHFSAFYPTYKMLNNIRTPGKILLNARRIAMDIGLKYVYTGNIVDIAGSTTYCPKCNTKIILRSGFSVADSFIEDSSCPLCNTTIDGIFK